MKAALPTSPFFYPILDLARVGRSHVAEAIAALAHGGARVFQLRAKELCDRDQFEAAGQAAAAARECGIAFIVNDRPDIALMVGANGVHLGQEDLAPAWARKLLGPGAIVGFSTHNLRQLETGMREPVDYLAVGPVFPTRSKARPDPVTGTDLLREARRTCDLRLVAIGGITLERVAEVVNTGVDGIAVISALFEGDDLARTSARFIRAVSGRA